MMPGICAPTGGATLPESTRVEEKTLSGHPRWDVVVAGAGNAALCEKPRETRGSPREAGSAVPRKALLDRYQSLLEAGRRPAIVAIERGHCSGCHVRLPTVVESRARMLPAVHICPHCRRLLYSPELLGADDQRLTGPEVGKPNVAPRARRRASALKASTPGNAARPPSGALE